MRQKLNAHVRHGAYLPHWTKDGATYHVRIRLCDSLPQHVLKEWKQEKKDIVYAAAKEKRGLTKNEKERLRELSSEKVERYLRAGYGACWLKQETVASLVANTLRKNDGEQYRLSAWSILWNHVHVVVRPLTKPLHKILEDWKGTSARKANRLLKRRGAFWQTEYFDHLIRNEESFRGTIDYVWKNPEEAGLKDWKWRWKAEDL